MLANLALSDGQLAHITLQQQAHADYRAAFTAAPVWDVAYWTNSNPRGGPDSNAVRPKPRSPSEQPSARARRIRNVG